MKKPCTTAIVSRGELDAKQVGGQTIEGKANKVKQNLNGYSRRNFIRALFATWSFEKAKRRSGVKEPYASEYALEIAIEAGYEPSGFRTWPRKSDVA